MWIAIWLVLDFMGFHSEPPHSEIPAVVEEYFGAEEAQTALGIFWCESLHRPTAVSHTDDHGLTQVSKEYWSEPLDHLWDRRYEVETSVRMARLIWTWGELKFGDGWLLWACYRNFS